MVSKKLIVAAIGIVVIVALFGGYFAFTKLSPAAENGDIVKVDYILKLENGSVIDTNIQKIAEENGIFNEQRKYEPMQITVGSGQVIPGFDRALIGMHKGQTKTVTIPPEEAYGEYKIESIGNITRKFEYDRVVNANFSKVAVPIENFVQHFGVNATKGAIVEEPMSDFKFKVLDVNEENATVIAYYKIGQVIQVPTTRFNATVIAVGANSVTFRQDPPESAYKQYGNVIYEVTPTKIIETVDVEVGERVPYGIIKEVNDDYILLDMNHPLAGKTLVFTITIVNIMKPAASK
ncbi:MAG: FKBP-type peptidyl-prolyl cis-trans isomerase [Candidatus Nanoarchaeia archaeon]